LEPLAKLQFCKYNGVVRLRLNEAGRDFGVDGEMEGAGENWVLQLPHLVENAFMIFKQWRGIATRYAKNTDSFLAAVCIRSLLHLAKLHT
jgi:transposase